MRDIRVKRKRSSRIIFWLFTSGLHEKNLGFGVDFDVNARKGKGAYIFKTLNDADIVAASKLFATDANEDAILKFIFQDKFKVKYNNATKNVIKQAKKIFINCLNLKRLKIL